jgi:flagellar biosynthesis protein FlhF
MNPYAPKTSDSSRNGAARLGGHAKQDLFAAGVYQEDEVPAQDAHDAVGAEISRLRAELRGEARALRSQIARPRVPNELLAEIATLRAAVNELLALPKQGAGIEQAVRTRGIEGAAAAALIRVAESEEAIASENGTIERLRSATAALVETSPWAPALMKEGRSLIALVGPAGVGKTTTAAKLAARALMAKKTVALVSCDSFRVGAMDQLARYADLLEARFHVATNQDELLDILAHEDADVVIVDTSGRAVEPDATEAVLGAADVRTALGNDRRVEILLCVPAALRASDAGRVHRDFAIALPTALCVTKLDETDTPAGILHAAFATKLPVSTFCAGQRVPEDIAPATASAIKNQLFPMATANDENPTKGPALGAR